MGGRGERSSGNFPLAVSFYYSRRIGADPEHRIGEIIACLDPDVGTVIAVTLVKGDISSCTFLRGQKVVAYGQFRSGRCPDLIAHTRKCKIENGEANNNNPGNHNTK